MGGRAQEGLFRSRLRLEKREGTNAAELKNAGVTCSAVFRGGGGGENTQSLLFKLHEGVQKTGGERQREKRCTAH